MTAWKRGLRGSELENTINHTIEQLRKDQLALIQKIPTPITPVKLDNHGHIILAFFEQKSTVDYIGVAQGIPVCFDAKECKEDTFPLKNIHPHQIKFMEDYEKQDGIAFFLLYFTHRKEYYFLTLTEALKYWERMEKGGRKSFRRDELSEKYFIQEKTGYIQFLPAINTYLTDKETQKDPAIGGDCIKSSGTL